MIIFTATLFSVFLLSFQQLNVVNSFYGYAITTSFLIAYFQFHMIKQVGNGKKHEWLYMGCGGALGVSLSMFVHGAVK